MSVKSPKELFVKMLKSDFRHRTAHAADIHENLSSLAQDPQIKEAPRVLTHSSRLGDLASLDRCFELIGEKPHAPAGDLREIVLEDFKRELAEIENPAAKALYVLVKANHLMHLRIAEYAVLIAMSDVTGHLGVGVIL